MMKEKMKLIMAIVAVIFLGACKKDKINIQEHGNALVKQAVTTYMFNGERSVTNYLYDDAGRLIGYGDGFYTYSYNAGGILMSYNGDSNFTLTSQFGLTDGRVNTLKYSRRQGSLTTEFLSTFYYDAKGRLLRIFAKELNLPADFAWTHNYLYTWDDNDNLLELKEEFSRKPDGTISSTYVEKYSGFDVKNVNTLGASNFGFNYFGAHSYPTNYSPTSDGSSIRFLRPAFSGKLLPSKITEGTLTTVSREYEVTYQKNDKGLITRIDKKDKTGNGSVILGFSYQ